MIRVYADWQPAYMASPSETKQKNFKTIEDAKPTIKKWKKTACNVIVFEVEEKEIAYYIWGKKQRTKHD